jgi:CHAT domain-containing protein
MMEGLRKRSNKDSQAGDKEFNRDCLKDLRLGLLDDIVEPVMKEIDSLNLPIERLWLCPTGPLTLLPLHAAFEAYKATDLIVSYTSTLAALIRARTTPPPSGDLSKATVLVVGQSNAPGEPELELLAASGESSLFDEFPSRFSVTRLEGDNAQVSTVLEALPQYEWAHFICHGHQDSLEPFKSYFRLRDGKLMLSSITLARLMRGQFAYVSACEGATGVRESADESVHLAAGLQFAGFRGVTAPLWKVRDQLTAEVARAFYKHLCDDGNRAPCASYGAKALHKAKKELLASKKASVLDLVPYIHIGI